MRVRQTIQYFFHAAMLYIIFFSERPFMIFAAYIVSVSVFVKLFNYISEREQMNQKLENQPDSSDNSNQLPKIVAISALQLLNLLAIFVLTWYVFEKKLRIFSTL